MDAPSHLRAHIRQYRFDSLIRWQTGAIVGALPFVLSISLMLFFAGLSIQLVGSDHRVAVASITPIVLTVVFHLASLILPAVCDCPWRTAISPGLFKIMFPLRGFLALCTPAISHSSGIIVRAAVTSPRILLRILVFSREVLLIFPRGIYRRMAYDDEDVEVERSIELHRYRLVVPPYLRPWLTKLTALGVRSYCAISTYFGSLARWSQHLSTESEASREALAIQTISQTLDVRSVLWLVNASTSPDVVDTSLQALSALCPDAECARIVACTDVIDMILRRFRGCFDEETLYAPIEAELYARCLLRLRLLLEGRATDLRGASSILSHAVNVAQKDHHTEAYITFICASAMLSEMADALERHFMGEQSLPPFLLRFLINALGDEMFLRVKQHEQHWVRSTNGHWNDGSIMSRILPILIHMLDVRSFSWPNDTTPTPTHTAIAFTLAVMMADRQTIDLRRYVQEDDRVNDFHLLVITALSPLIRFPSTYGCDDKLLSVARSQYIIAYRSLPNSIPGTKLNIDIFSVALDANPSNPSLSLEQAEDVLVSLSRRSLGNAEFTDFGPLFSVLRATFDHAQSYSSDRDDYDESKVYRTLTLALNSVDTVLSAAPGSQIFLQIPQFVTILADLISFTRHEHLGIRSKSFHILVRAAHSAYTYGRRDVAVETMVQYGLLGAIRDFFESPAYIAEDDLQTCLKMISAIADDSVLCSLDSLTLFAVIQAIRRWSETWCGAVLMSRYRAELAIIASNIGFSLLPDNDTSWFPGALEILISSVVHH